MLEKVNNPKKYSLADAIARTRPKFHIRRAYLTKNEEGYRHDRLDISEKIQPLTLLSIQHRQKTICIIC